MHPKDKQSLAKLMAAYMTLLEMQHGGIRARNQYCMCVLRDAIAKETGFSAQEVQDTFEEKVLREKLAA